MPRGRAISEVSATGLLSGLDRLRGESAQADGGLTRVRGELTRLRGDTKATPGRVETDVTDIRGAIADLSTQVADFSGVATTLRATLRAANPNPAATGSDPVQVQARTAADAAGRHAIAAQAGLNDVAGDVSGLQRGLPKS